MKKRLIDPKKLYSTIGLFLVLGALVHFLFGFQPDPSAEQTSPWTLHLVLYSMGFSLLILGVLSETTSLIGVDFYEGDENSVRFAHHRNVIRFKYTVFFIALVLLSLGVYLIPTSFSGASLTSFQDIRLAAGILAALILIVQIIRSYRRLVFNREDYLEIGTERIRWYDNEDGSVKILPASEIQSIRFIYESQAESPDVVAAEVNAADKNYRIEFRRMSLLPHGKKIRQEFERFYLGKIVSK